MFDIKESQSRILEIMIWFHDFCSKNGLRYYMLCGTLLGALRHSGFIPWDDDIDVGMPRKDYEEFLRLTDHKKFGRFIVEENANLKDRCAYLASKVYDTETTMVQKGKIRLRRGLYIDVFPLDGVGNTHDEVKQNYKPILQLERLLYTRQSTVRPGRSLVKNAAIMLSDFIPDSILNEVKLQKEIYRLCREHDYDDSKYVGNLMGNYYEREIVDKDIFGKPVLYRFENMDFYGPEDADAYLTHIYGYYMQLPPEDKRVSLHEFVEFDLNKSFLRSR